MRERERVFCEREYFVRERVFCERESILCERGYFVRERERVFGEREREGIWCVREREGHFVCTCYASMVILKSRNYNGYDILLSLYMVHFVDVCVS